MSASLALTTAARQTLYQLSFEVVSAKTETSKAGNKYKVAIVRTVRNGKTVEVEARATGGAFASLATNLRKGAKLTVTGYWHYGKIVICGRGRGYGRQAANEA